MTEYQVDIEYPIDYDGPIKVKLEIPMPMAGCGSVRTVSGSKKLYVDFRYKKIERILKTTELADTTHNCQVAQAILNELVFRAKMGRGEYAFVFEDLFPDATNEQKERIAKLDKREYHPLPEDVLFGDYVEYWMNNHLYIHTDSKQETMRDIVPSQILPYFKDYNFYDINRLVVIKFIQQMRNVFTGEQLSPKRAKAVITAFRLLWNDAVEEYRWLGRMQPPYDNLSRYYPDGEPAQRVAFRYHEFVSLKKYLIDVYRNIVDFMMLTGASPSEVAGLKKDHVLKGHIHFQESFVKKYNKPGKPGKLKEKARNRLVPITKEIRKRLDFAFSYSHCEYVFVMEDGSQFDQDDFRDKSWKQAATKAGVDHIPYEMRHSFVAWCHIVGIDMIRIVSLIGHSSKEQVNRRYGFHVEGLEDDCEKIIVFFGPDFVKSKGAIEQPLLKGKLGSDWKGRR